MSSTSSPNHIIAGTSAPPIHISFHFSTHPTPSRARRPSMARATRISVYPLSTQPRSLLLRRLVKNSPKSLPIRSRQLGMLLPRINLLPRSSLFNSIRHPPLESNSSSHVGIWYPIPVSIHRHHHPSPSPHFSSYMALSPSCREISFEPSESTARILHSITLCS